MTSLRKKEAWCKQTKGAILSVCESIGYSSLAVLQLKDTSFNRKQLSRESLMLLVNTLYEVQGYVGKNMERHHHRDSLLVLGRQAELMLTALPNGATRK